jgi:phosphoribosylformylglycinamidine synthase
MESLHDCSDGGLIAAVAECCFAAYPYMQGCDLGIEGPARPDAYLFGESQGRYILSCKSQSLSRLRSILGHYRLPHALLGKTGGRDLIISVNGKNLIHLSVEELYSIWYNSITNLM